MKPRFVVLDRDNQLANRLFVFAALIGCAEDLGATVVNLGFDDYAELFPTTAGDALCRYPRRRTPFLTHPKVRAAVRRAATALLRRAPVMRSGYESTINKSPEESTELTVNLDAEETRAALRASRVTVFAGPLVRGDAAVARHRDKIRSFFEPHPSSRAAVRAVMDATRATHDVVVGVHIRRGDYKEWEGGRYYFAFARYAEIMRGVRDTLLPGARVSFLVCSNEPWDDAAFGDLAVFAAPGGITEDLAALSACDLIVGPPSTFSMWASFVERVPIWFIRDEQHLPALDEFSVPYASPGEVDDVLERRRLRTWS